MKQTLKLVTKDVNKDIADIEKCAEILKNGGIAVIPTETVYGLAADAFNPEAVKNIFKAKGRPSENPLIVHISRFDEIYNIAREVPESAKKLAEAFWPGPLTMILPKRDEIPSVTSGNLDTVAIRMPSNPIANKIIALSCPLAAPSANISGFPSPSSYEYALADMDTRADAVCDGGDCDVGVESTVITLASPVPRLLRPGGITVEQLRSVLGRVDVDEAVLNPLAKDKTAASPGMKYKHYAPNAEITIIKGNLKEFNEFISKNDPENRYGVLCFEGEEDLFKNRICVTMGRYNEPLTQTHRLFDALRELDEQGAKKVYSRAPSKQGVGLAVCNRLYRSAAFRFINAIKRPIVGLTGQTGAGKGYVGEYLKKLNCAVIDTDEIAHNITEKGSDIINELINAFGDSILDNDGNVIRAKLASIAFSTKENTLKLNSVMHPEIMRIAKEKADFALEEGSAAAVIDAPLLFEAGGDKICDTVIAVTAPEDIRLKRITERDSITPEQARMRMSAQHDDEFYISKSDFTVRSYPPYKIEDELKQFVNEYINI